MRPIINLEMHDEFCEVFFDDVRVPEENLVGQVNQGWTMAKALLGFERIFLGSARQSAYALSRLRQLAERMGVLDDPAFADRYTQLRSTSPTTRRCSKCSPKSCAPARRSAPTSPC